MHAKEKCWIHRFTMVLAAATLVLICAGGVVTSKGVGLSVPDWPTTYGYNMFFFPISQWVGGVFYEHTHRLIASGVGFLTTILAVWLWFGDRRRWMRILGVVAFVGVVLQGVLGGLRVTELMDELGIVHATLAQLFFALVCALALFTSRWWTQTQPGSMPAASALRRVYLAATIFIFLQLVLGATMRHQHAGLAIPDFPLAYGKIWPALDPASVERYNQLRHEAVALNPITPFAILLQMTHRVLAAAILAAVASAAWATWRRAGRGHALWRVSALWLGLILLQVVLGIFTIWTNKSADIATAHVAVGALSLVTGTVLSLMAGRLAAPAVHPVAAPAPHTNPGLPDLSQSPA